MNEWVQGLNELMRRLLVLPEQASTFAIRIDRLHYFVFIVTMVSSVGVGLAAVYFFFRYRERRKNASTPKVVPSVRFETIVIAIPLVFFLVWFVHRLQGLHLVHDAAQGRDGRVRHGQEVDVEVRLSRTAPTPTPPLHVPAHRPVRLLMTSRDVIHSFFVPEFRIKQDVMPGPLHRDLVRGDQARPLPDLLHRVLRHLALADGGRGGGDGAGRLRHLAGAAAAGAGRAGRHQRRGRVRPGELPRSIWRPTAGGSPPCDGCFKCHTSTASRTSAPPGSTSTAATRCCRTARPWSPTRPTSPSR